jgi:hypothetical protein
MKNGRIKCLNGRPSDVQNPAVTNATIATYAGSEPWTCRVAGETTARLTVIPGCDTMLQDGALIQYITSYTICVTSDSPKTPTSRT